MHTGSTWTEVCVNNRCSWHNSVCLDKDTPYCDGVGLYSKCQTLAEIDSSAMPVCEANKMIKEPCTCNGAVCPGSVFSFTPPGRTMEIIVLNYCTTNSVEWRQTGAVSVGPKCIREDYGSRETFPRNGAITGATVAYDGDSIAIPGLA